jgi:hypothetical protein
MRISLDGPALFPDVFAILRGAPAPEASTTLHKSAQRSGAGVALAGPQFGVKRLCAE